MTGDDTSTAGSRAIRLAERVIYLAVAVVLAAAALLTLGKSVALLIGTMFGAGDGSAIFDTIDMLLFVLMLVELLHSVGASIKQGVVVAEPFFIVAIIACIRRILVITLGTSQITRPNDWTPQNASLFRAAMVELGVLALLLLVLVSAIYAMRRMDRQVGADPDGPRP
jgi:uncharacterized membrane protein (DUF373 family)